MKIMIHSNGPMVPSGYGRQTAIAVNQFTELGHEVAVSAFHGVTGSIIDWYGVPVYPSGMAPFGVDVMLQHANHFGADVLLTLMDTWTLMPILDHLTESLKLQGAPQFACWTPVDCDPIGQGDRRVLAKSRALPIAMSDFGVTKMAEAGLTGVWYVPHSVNTNAFRPIPEARSAVREEYGTAPGTFVVGILAANRDLTRKSWAEQFEAFSLHLNRHPDSELWVHTISDGTRGSGGFNLRTMASQMGIAHRVKWTDDYAQMAGLIEDADLALWYNSIDLLSNCSYGEGFGLPMVEAQACGTPVVATRASAMTELANFLVGGTRWWNALHDGWWVRPSPIEIAEVYGTYLGDIRNGTHEPPHIVAERVQRFAVDRVTDAYWKPVLDRLAAGE